MSNILYSSIVVKVIGGERGSRRGIHQKTALKPTNSQSSNEGHSIINAYSMKFSVQFVLDLVTFD